MQARRVMEIHPIGEVHSPISGEKWSDWEEVVAEIEIAPEWEAALTGIEEFSHIVVIFWLDRAEIPGDSLIHPRDLVDLPLVGFLATRTPNRPNPIALTVPRLLSRRGRFLTVKGLDAFDGSKVIDIKPYIPPLTPDTEAHIPLWIKQSQSRK
jgi:tRNA-Thr(GGU) m(6)t(6)A37 methyltransferase TsaA